MTISPVIETGSVITLTERGEKSVLGQGFQYRVVKELGSGSFCTAYEAELISEVERIVPIYLRQKFTIEVFNKKAIEELIPTTNWDFLQVLDPDRFAYPLASFSTEALLEKNSTIERIKVAVMPFFPGTDVFDYIANKYENENEKEMGITNLEEQRDFAAQLCTLVEEMHAKGILHLDVKPENLIIDEEKRIGLIDLTSSSDKNTVDPLSFIGSAIYMSPEMIFNKCLRKSGIIDNSNPKDIQYKIPIARDFVMEINEKADIWSMLVTLFAVFSGTQIVFKKTADGKAVNGEDVDSFMKSECDKLREFLKDDSLASNPEAAFQVFQKYQEQFFERFQDMVFAGIAEACRKAVYKERLLSLNLEIFFRDVLRLNWERPTIEYIKLEIMKCLSVPFAVSQVAGLEGVAVESVSI